MILKYQSTLGGLATPQVDLFDGYKRIQGRIELPDETKPNWVVGLRREDIRWSPMKVMAWRSDSEEIDVLFFYLGPEDDLFVLNERGVTVDRLH